MLRSNGTGPGDDPSVQRRPFPATAIGSADQLFVADFDGDNKDDLYLFTALSWTTRTWAC